MNYKIYTPILVLLGILSAGAGYSLMSGKPTQQAAFPMAPTYSPADQDNRTPDQVLATEVRGPLRTFTCAGGILAKEGQLCILNNAHYKSRANVSTVFPTSLLPANYTPDLLKGKVIEAQGSLSEYKGKKQWQATSITVK